MSLNSVLGSATSGLFAAQTQLKVVSDNIANVNTPGYAREVVSQTPVSGLGKPVEVIRSFRPK